jgi:hypothetical protein
VKERKYRKAERKGKRKTLEKERKMKRKKLIDTERWKIETGEHERRI